MSGTTPARDARRFPDTQWSQLVDLADRGDPRRVEHLDRLLRGYWKPAYHYVRAIRSVSRQDAEDLTQGFFTMVLAQVDFATLSPERGSFRGFLKTALRRHIGQVERRGAARITRASIPLPSLPFAEAESSALTATTATPEEAFDRAWARHVLDEAMATLKAELGAQGKARHYEIFHAYCLDPEDGVSYQSLADRHGLKADDVRNHLRSVRQRAREIMKDMIRDYLMPQESVEQELRFILSQ